ncbi:SDR family oxidoreductase [Sinobaca sp. H24]|uniref:SDR family oxidoreductase n=1 Tax=Sinobaca sp. H24 TaxID=2923376 RepID=UPI00207A0E5E|nr:SDR family oxidoreductase [Sinobaca sp. H24]
MKALEGKVAMVAGATRGAGRGIAVMLGEAGATVYCSGRSTRGAPSDLNRPETIDDTAEMVTAYGGKGIPVRTDHTVVSEVEALFERIDREQQGQLDLVVNDIWGGEKWTEWNIPFWEHNLSNGLMMQERAVHSHMITSYYAARLMTKKHSGLIVEITDGTDYSYRGNLYYTLAKSSIINLVTSMSEELSPYNTAVVSITPGFLRSEEMLDYFGVSESNWQDAVVQDSHFAQSETPFFVGRAVASLAADPKAFSKTGRHLSSWGLSEEYGFKDIDGRKPHWGNYYQTIKHMY